MPFKKCQREYYTLQWKKNRNLKLYEEIKISVKVNTWTIITASIVVTLAYNSTFGFFHYLREKYTLKMISLKISIIVNLVCIFTFCFLQKSLFVLFETDALKFFIVHVLDTNIQRCTFLTLITEWDWNWRCVGKVFACYGS